MGKKKSTITNKNYQFIDSAILNNATYNDYLDRFRKVALSIFEWINLPETMNAQWLERSLYLYGMASFLFDNDYGFINTNCAINGKLNIYGLPTSLNCYSFEYQQNRKLYTGLKDIKNDKEAILVQNNWDRTPTCGSMELFAYRLYETQRSADVNIIAQKTPVLILVNDKQRLTLQNMYNQYNGNQPAIFGDADQLSDNAIRSINTNAPFVADKLTDYKKEIWNEALTFLGINNIMLEKKERLVQDEANSNNELINLNLQSFLAPRKLACKQFNEKFNPEKPIDVRVRSDLYNIIKNTQSIVSNAEREFNSLKQNYPELYKNGGDR